MAKSDWNSPFGFLDSRPIVIALAGSNGAGKTTFYKSHLADTGLRFINADDLAHQLSIDAYEAAEAALAIRGALIATRESFIFETVFSDPVGSKVDMLAGLNDLGYEVVLVFIQIADPGMSVQRVSMRVAQGGHDVPDEKLIARFDRTLANLNRALAVLPNVIIFDNSDLSHPYRHVATYREGHRLFAAKRT